MKISGFAMGVLLLAVFASNVSGDTCSCRPFGIDGNSGSHEICVHKTITAQEPIKNLRHASPAAIRQAAAIRASNAAGINFNGRPRRSGRNRGCLGSSSGNYGAEVDTMGLLNVGDGISVIPRFETIQNECTKHSSDQVCGSCRSSSSPNFSVTPAKQTKPICSCTSSSPSLSSSFSFPGITLKGHRGPCRSGKPFPFPSPAGPCGFAGPAIGDPNRGGMGMAALFGAGPVFNQRSFESLSTSFGSKAKENNETSCDTKKYGHVLPFEEQEKIYSGKSSGYGDVGPAVPADAVSIALAFNKLFAPVGSIARIGIDSNAVDPMRKLNFGHRTDPIDGRNSKASCDVREESLSIISKPPIELKFSNLPCGIAGVVKKERIDDIAIQNAMAREWSEQNNVLNVGIGPAITYRDLGFKTVGPGCNKFIPRSSCGSPSGPGIIAPGPIPHGLSPLGPGPFVPGPISCGSGLGPSSLGPRSILSGPLLPRPVLSGPTPYGSGMRSCGCPLGAPCNCGLSQLNGLSASGLSSYGQDILTPPMGTRVRISYDDEDDDDDYEGCGCN